MRELIFATLFGVFSLSAGAAETVVTGVDLIRGSFVPGTQPDGNSVIFRTAGGLVVVDTGRHAEHTQRIIDYAHEAALPIQAVVNSHWHLDHIGGNPRIRAAYPDVQVYASAAIDDAMHGFLADYRKQLEGAIAQAKDDAKAQQQAWRDEIAIIDSGKALYPDVTIERTQTRRIGGREFEIHLESHAVTAGDVWIYDPKTSVLAAGDLVTLPVPFLDTACPARWKAALDGLGAKPFKVLIPGHGAPLSREQFETYRNAYANLVTCAASDRSKSVCIDGWVGDAGALLSTQESKLAKSLLDYYIDNSLHADAAKTAKLCGR